MSLEKRLSRDTHYHTLSGQWKTDGKLFASMAVPLTINRVTTVFSTAWRTSSDPQNFRHLVTVLQHAECFLTGMTMSIILFPSDAPIPFLFFYFRLSPATHTAHDHAHILCERSNPVRDLLLVFALFCFWFSVTGSAKFCFTIRWPAILSASSPGRAPAVCHEFC